MQHGTTQIYVHNIFQLFIPLNGDGEREIQIITEESQEVGFSFNQYGMNESYHYRIKLMVCNENEDKILENSLSWARRNPYQLQLQQRQIQGIIVRLKVNNGVFDFRKERHPQLVRFSVECYSLDSLLCKSFSAQYQISPKKRFADSDSSSTENELIIPVTWISPNKVEHQSAEYSGSHSVADDDSLSSMQFAPSLANSQDYSNDTNNNMEQITEMQDSYMVLYNGNAEVVGNFRALNFYKASDINLKENIRLLTEDYDCRDILMKIDGVNYNFKKGVSHATNKRFVGYIAQQIEKFVPETVQLIDGVLHVDYESLIPYLSEAIKQNYRDMSNMETKVDKIQQVIDSLYKSFVNKEQKPSTEHSFYSSNGDRCPSKSRWIVAAMVVIALLFSAFITAFVYTKVKDTSAPQLPASPLPTPNSPLPQPATPSINSPSSPYDSSFNTSKDFSALADLYWATNGANWTYIGAKFGNPWFTPNTTICTWQGIGCNSVKDQRVKTLHLSGFNLRGTIPDSISTLEFLQLVSLSGNYIYGTIPPSIGKLRNLAELNLGGNMLQGTIPEDIAKLQLEDLILSNNQLEGSISFLFGYKAAFRNIDFQNNFLNGTIPKSIFYLPSLQYLSFSNNQFMKATIEPEIFTHALKVINLSNCNLVGTIPSTITNALLLSQLNLSSNHLEGTLPQFAKSLDKLDVSGNQLSGSPAGIPASKIMVLNLSNNHFNGSVGFVNRFLSVGELYLQNNNFTGEFLLSNRLVDSITCLNMASNHLQYFNPNVTKPTYIKSCDLSNNDWICPLPEWASSFCKAGCFSKR